MDSHEILEHNNSSLSTSTNLPPSLRPKVLGLYGLPGSGKSTLCKILGDHFFPIYAGKSLYMELPTNPSLVDLVNKFKLLLRFTNFRERINLEYGASELEQVERLLRSYELRSCNVFLVVDNISDKSVEAVQRILLVGFGPSSKIILVARSRDILLPVLKSLKSGHDCICDSMRIPNIDEREAKEILLQTATRIGSVGLDGYIPQQHLTLEQTEIVLRIVRSCGFGPGVYLPLVMKIVGRTLIKYKGNLEEWGSDQEGFWTGVKDYKEDAVKELVEESFKALPNEALQVLFMDVALFIVPSKLWGFHEVCTLLGFMHEKSPSRMEQMLQDLERYCFLTVGEDGRVSVHDVYLEFAKSMQEDSPGFMKWSWRNEYIIHTDGLRALLQLKEDRTMKGEHHERVRSMILEVEGCEKVELQSFSGLKAVVVRDCSKSLQVLRLAGLSSLVSLEIGRCASLQRLECSDNDYASLRNVKRLIIETTKGSERSSRVNLLHIAEEWEQVPIYLRPIFSYLWQRVIAPAAYNMHSINPLGIGIAFHMRGLQVLRLEGTGIRRLGDMSNYWPQLQDLTIYEGYLQSFQVGNLPRLKRFHFNDNTTAPISFRYTAYAYRDSESWKRREGDPRFMLRGKNLLVGCPELEEVEIQSAFFEGGELGTLPQNLLALELSCFYTATALPDISSLSHKLERLALEYCEKLERVNLLVEFRNLTDLSLSGCLNVVEVGGLGLLPSLRRLHVYHCPKLRALVGFDNSKMLKWLRVEWCPELREIACLRGLTGLEDLKVEDCENLTSLVSAGFENLMKLKTLAFPLSSDQQSGSISLQNLRNLEELDLHFAGSGSIFGIEKTRGLFEGSLQESLVELRLRRGDASSSASNEISLNLDFSSFLVGSRLPVDADSCSGLCSMKYLTLNQWPELAGMGGIQHLVNLTRLQLRNLGNLKSVQGLEFLIHLTALWLENCPLLAELPSLQALVNMEYLSIRDCPKIEAVEGCNEMRGLERAEFDGCESLSCLPFSDLYMVEARDSLHLSFRGCKFILERTVAWAVEEETPRPLRLASLKYLAWEYYRTTDVLKRCEKERVVDVLFPRLINRLLPHHDDCFNNLQGLLTRLEQIWNDEWSSSWCPLFPRAAAQELGRRLQGKPKKDLLQNYFTTHKLSLLRFLDDAQVARMLPWRTSELYRVFTQMWREGHTDDDRF